MFLSSLFHSTIVDGKKDYFKWLVGGISSNNYSVTPVSLIFKRLAVS